MRVAHRPGPRRGRPNPEPTPYRFFRCLSKNASRAFSAFSASSPLKPWPGPLQRQQFRLDVRRLQPVDQPDRLLVGDVLVLGAVDAQRRGGVRRHPVERAGPDVLPAGLLQVAAQEQRQHLGRVHALAVGLREVARAVDVDHAGDPARLRRGCRRRPRTPSRPPVTPRNCARWPPAEPPVTPMRSGSMWYFAALAREPADGRLDVVDGGGERVLRGQAVADGHGDVAVLRPAGCTGRRSPRDCRRGSRRRGCRGWPGTGRRRPWAGPGPAGGAGRRGWRTRCPSRRSPRRWRVAPSAPARPGRSSE